MWGLSDSMSRGMSPDVERDGTTYGRLNAWTPAEVGDCVVFCRAVLLSTPLALQNIGTN
jgi:hypothetical protein